MAKTADATGHNNSDNEDDVGGSRFVTGGMRVARNVAGVDDSARLGLVLDALERMGCGLAERARLIAAVAAVLVLGRLRFVNGTMVACRGDRVRVGASAGAAQRWGRRGAVG